MSDILHRVPLPPGAVPSTTLDSVLATLAKNGGVGNDDNPYNLKRVTNLDRTTYHDSSADRRDLPGTILPAGRHEGASAAFDGTKPAIVVVNPSTLGEGGFQLDMNRLTGAEQTAAYAAAASRFPQAGPKDRAIAAYAIMADMIKYKDSQAAEKTAEAQSAVKLAAVAVAPTQVTSPSSAPVGSLRNLLNATPVNGNITMPTTSAKRKVEFELPDPIGLWPCFYHDVVRTEELLILVYTPDVGHPKWFPPVPKMDKEPSSVCVLVYDEGGQPDRVLSVFPTAGQFHYAGFDFCMLAIDKDAPYRPPNQELTHGLPRSFG